MARSNSSRFFSRSIYGTILKILGDIVIKLLHSQSWKLARPPSGVTRIAPSAFLGWGIETVWKSVSEDTDRKKSAHKDEKGLRFCGSKVLLTADSTVFLTERVHSGPECEQHVDTFSLSDRRVAHTPLLGYLLCRGRGAGLAASIYRAFDRWYIYSDEKLFHK